MNGIEASGIRHQASGAYSLFRRRAHAAQVSNTSDFPANVVRAGANHREVKDAATQLVASAFVLPVLESLHTSPLRPSAGPFAAGAAEKRFAPLLHQQFADNIVRASNFGLVDSIVKRFAQTPPPRNTINAHG